MKPHRHVQRPLERVGKLELRVNELLGNEPGQPLFALDRDSRARAQRRLENVSVQQPKIVEGPEPHADDGERVDRRDSGQPRLRGVPEALAPFAGTPHRRRDLPAKRPDLNDVVSVGCEPSVVEHLGPRQHRGAHSRHSWNLHIGRLGPAGVRGPSVTRPERYAARALRGTTHRLS